ncbi:MAG: CbiQ family ECF transporter T component [bacterium]
MKIADIDYYSIYGNTLLHRASASLKALGVITIIAFSLISNNLIALSALLILLYCFLFSMKFAKIKLLLITLYPLMFLTFYFLSFDKVSIFYIAKIIIRSLNCSTVCILLALTTPYIELMKAGDKIIPSFLLNFMFLTYRSFFILWGLLEQLKTAIHIRGQLSIKRPLYSLKTIARLVGFIIIKAIEKSEIMYDCMKVRGYSDKLKYLQD